VIQRARSRVLGGAAGGGAGGEGAERLEVGADGFVAAGVAAVPELGVELAGAGAAVVPPLAEVGLVGVEDGRPAGGGEEFPGASGAEVAADGVPGHAGLAHDPPDGRVPCFEGLDLLVALAGAGGGPGVPGAAGGGLRRGLLQVRDARGSRPGFRGGVVQAAAVAGHGPGRVLAEVVIQVPAVGDLDGAGGAAAGAVGVGAGPVPEDHLHLRLAFQPGDEGGGQPVREQVDGPAGLGVDQQCAVAAAPAEREVVDAEDPHGAGVRVRQGHDQAQQRRPGRGHRQLGGQPGPGPPGQGQPDRGQQPGQQRRPPRPRRGQLPELLGERDRRAVPVTAVEPAHRQQQRHRLPARRRVGQPPPVPGMHPRGKLPAPAARRVFSARPGPDPQAAALRPDGLDDQPRQVRQEHLHGDPAPA
jgi:hypothetical protein